MKKTISYIGIVCVIVVVVLYSFLSVGTQKNTNNTQSPAGLNDVKNNSLKVKIIAVGDSLTAGYNLPLSESYPKILEKRLLDAGKNVEVINAGISGETTAGLLERAQFISEQKPDILLITIGGNDAFRNLPLENTKDNIKKALNIFKQNIDAKNIYLLQIEATANLGSNYRNEFNAMYKEIANTEQVNLVPFVVREVFLDSTKMLPDAIHPNKNGYEFIVDTYIFPIVQKNID